MKTATRNQRGRSSARKQSAWPVITVLLAVVAVVTALIIAIAATGGGSKATGKTVVDVAMGDMWFQPSVIEVPAGHELVVNATNVGEMTHDLKLLGDKGTDFLHAGESEEVSLGVIEADTQAWCTVAGHREAGMVLDIVVTDQ
jgi:nitrite reductase (NO-forming)